MLWIKKIRGPQFQNQFVENDLVKTKKKRGDNMKFYFAGAIRGGRDKIQTFIKINEA